VDNLVTLPADYLFTFRGTRSPAHRVQVDIPLGASADLFVRESRSAAALQQLRAPV